MSDFKLKGAPLSANINFMDINKHKEQAKEVHREADAFDNFKSYNHQISMLFSDLPKDHRFWTVDGMPLHNLHELYDAFETMPDTVYQHHVTGDRNDFATWVSNVYHDEDLAYKLHKAKNRLAAKRAIEDRIEELISVGEKHTTEDSFFKALIKKLSKQNQKLEAELNAKKQWILKKEHEMEGWEAKNIEHEKKLYEKYALMEAEEKKLYDKFQHLQSQEAQLTKALADEKKQIAQQQKELEDEQKKIHSEHEKIAEEQKALESHKQDIKTQRDERVKQVMSQRNRHIYERVDELLGYASACIYNHNFKEARDTMSKVKYYYNTLPHEDPHKKEIYKKIMLLRKQLTESL